MDGIITAIEGLGATVGRARVAQLTFDRGFRSLCETNACGNYDKSWMCPPAVGAIDGLIAQAKSYDQVIVYQTIGMLEDSYDFEGMMAAAEGHNKLTATVRQMVAERGYPDVLHLGAGGCRQCPTCAKREGKPCRHPDLALASLEAYGIDVTQLAKVSGLKYINGENTVTYFSGMFLKGGLS